MSGYRPAWGRLYAILPTTGLLCAVAHWMAPAGIWRTLSAFGVIGMTIGLLALWLAGNRTALAYQGDPASPPSASRVRVVYVYVPLRSWRLASPKVALQNPPAAQSMSAPSAPLPALSSADLQVVTRG